MPLGKKTIPWLAAILIVTAACLSPILQNDFINRDDPSYIIDNELIKEVSFQNIGKIFSTPQYEGDYHPLTMLCFAVQYNFFHNRPQGYHTMSLLLHLVATMLVFIVFLQLSKELIIACIVSLLFGIHPTHVESVAWISQQKDMLYAIFYLCSFSLYIKYVRTESSPKLIYLGTLLFFILSLLSKTMAVSFAVVIFLVDYVLARQFSKKLVIEKIPFLALAVAFGMWAITAHSIAGAFSNEVSYGFYDRLLLAGYAAFKYIMTIIIPFKLSAYYPYPFSPGQALVIMTLYPLGILLLIAGILRTHRTTRKIVFGGGFFFLNIATIMQVFPLAGAYMADRYTYVASLGLFYLAGSAACFLSEKYDYRRSVKKIVIWAGVGLVSFMFAVMTWNRTSAWNNSVTLWTDVISRFPNVPFIYVYRGNARRLPEENTLALADFNKAINLNSDLGIAFYSRGYVYASSGDHEAAIVDYSRAIDLHYEPHLCYSNRGSSFTSLGQIDKALADFTHAIQMNPGYADPYFNRANVYLRLGQYRMAI